MSQNFFSAHFKKDMDKKAKVQIAAGLFILVLVFLFLFYFNPNRGKKKKQYLCGPCNKTDAGRPCQRGMGGKGHLSARKSEPENQAA